MKPLHLLLSCPQCSKSGTPLHVLAPVDVLVVYDTVPPVVLAVAALSGLVVFAVAIVAVDLTVRVVAAMVAFPVVGVGAAVSVGVALVVARVSNAGVLAVLVPLVAGTAVDSAVVVTVATLAGSDVVVTGSTVVDNGIGGAEDDAVPDVVYGVIESGLGLLVCFVVVVPDSTVPVEGRDAQSQSFSPPMYSSRESKVGLEPCGTLCLSMQRSRPDNSNTHASHLTLIWHCASHSAASSNGAKAPGPPGIGVLANVLPR